MVTPGSIIGGIFEAIVLLVLVGAAIVGGIGALISRARGGTAISGVLWSLMPIWPVGWGIVLWRTRRSRTFPRSGHTSWQRDPLAAPPSADDEGQGSGGIRF